MASQPQGTGVAGAQNKVAAAQPGVAGNPAAGQAAAATRDNRDYNSATLCKMGRENVQDIVSKTSELFQHLKALQLPNSEAASQQYADRKAKVDELTKTITVKFRYLHLIYDKLNEYASDQMIDVDHMCIVTGDKYKETPKPQSEEYQQIVEQIQAKNAQLKAIIDKLRTVVWEINTMMAMKKSGVGS